MTLAGARSSSSGASVAQRPPARTLDRHATTACPDASPRDHDHGDPGFAHHAIRHAPAQETTYPPTCVAAQDDDLGALGAGGVEDRFGGVAFPDQGHHPE